MAKLILVVAVVMALAMTNMPTFSHPHSRVVPQPLPAWEQIDAKLQALAAEKQIKRKQSLRDFLMGEVSNLVTYEVEKVDVKALWQMSRSETSSTSRLRIRQPLKKKPSALPLWRRFGNSNGSPHQKLPASAFQPTTRGSGDILLSNHQMST